MTQRSSAHKMMPILILFEHHYEYHQQFDQLDGLLQYVKVGVFDFDCLNLVDHDEMMY